MQRSNGGDLCGKLLSGGITPAEQDQRAEQHQQGNGGPGNRHGAWRRRLPGLDYRDCPGSCLPVFDPIERWVGPVLPELTERKAEGVLRSRGFVGVPGTRYDFSQEDSNVGWQMACWPCDCSPSFFSGTEGSSGCTILVANAVTGFADRHAGR